MQGVVTPTQLREVEAALGSLVAGLRVDLVTPREAPALVEAFARIARLATGGEMLLARLVDDSSAARDAGLRNGAEWIARTVGSSPSAGHEMVAASRRLEKLPVVAAAVARGQLSAYQAKAIADAATADPSAERRLVALAGSVSMGELRDECARVKAAADPDPEATHARLHRERRLRTFRNDDGGWCLSGRGTADAGAEVSVVLDAITDEIFREARDNGIHETRDAYRFDALVEMSRRAWRDMHQDDDSAQIPDGESAVTPPRRKRRTNGVNPRFLAQVRIDHLALVRGWVEGDETCEITGIGPVSVPVARKILGDALLELLVTKGQEVATVVTSARGPNARQRAALRWLYPECAGKGCHRPVAEWDHRRPYADVPVTSIHNLDGLCHYCHALKTHDGWALLPGTGKREMVPPTDKRHPGNPTFHKRRTAALPTRPLSTLGRATSRRA